MNMPANYEELANIALEAVAWINDPFQMADDLENELDRLLESFELGMDSTDMVQAIYVRKPTDGVWLGGLFFQSAKDSVRLVNCIAPEIPFSATLFDGMRDTENAKEFTVSVFRFRSEVSFLRAYSQAKYLLRQPAISGNGGDVATERLSVNIEAMRYMAENMGEITRQLVKDWVAEGNNRQRTQLEDVKSIFEGLKATAGRLPTREELKAAIRAKGMKIGSDRLQSFVNEIQKQSAIRPPESAD